MYLKWGFILMVMSTASLFWFIWGEFQRLREQLIIAKSQTEQYRNEALKMIQHESFRTEKEVLNTLREDNKANQSAMLKMSEEITEKIESMEEEQKRIGDSVQKLTQRIDDISPVVESSKSLVSQMSNLMNYSVGGE